MFYVRFRIQYLHNSLLKILKSYFYKNHSPFRRLQTAHFRL